MDSVKLKYDAIVAREEHKTANNNSQLIDLSNQSIEMDKSAAFYKSYFNDCSSISNLDDSQLFHETKIPRAAKPKK